MNFSLSNGGLLCDNCSLSLSDHLFNLSNHYYQTDSLSEAVCVACPFKFCMECLEKKPITDFAAYKTNIRVHHTCKECQTRHRKNSAFIRKYLKDHKDDNMFY